MERYCSKGQSPQRAVAPTEVVYFLCTVNRSTIAWGKRKKKKKKKKMH
jgi:hypothetical protein